MGGQSLNPKSPLRWKQAGSNIGGSLAPCTVGTGVRGSALAMLGGISGHGQGRAVAHVPLEHLGCLYLAFPAPR